MGQIDIGEAITLGIGIGGDAFEIEIVEFGIDLKARTERFSFVVGLRLVSSVNGYCILSGVPISLAQLFTGPSYSLYRAEAVMLTRSVMSPCRTSRPPDCS
ncbi:MAG: hypothetical protein CM15mP84_05350 [Cellvibrionales bacterium]|nr:MAG: hypothetical protein CM15mP84_05350 [Cellvibrionales bacterium]